MTEYDAIVNIYFPLFEQFYQKNEVTAMKFGLSDDTIRMFHSVFERYPEVEKVIIDGSRAKGNYREGSDIDITLIGPNLTKNTRSKIWLALDELNHP